MSLAIEKFSKNFDGYTVPPILLALLGFQNRVGEEEYSQAISLLRDDKSGLTRGWSSAPEFLAALFPFASATGTGSFYALWKQQPDVDLNECPVVVFGDEGGEWVIARNLRELLTLTTFDIEPMIDHDGICFYKDEDDYEENDALDEYKAWLKTAFDIESTNDPDSIVAAAQAALQAPFEQWKKQFLA